MLSPSARFRVALMVGLIGFATLPPARAQVQLRQAPQAVLPAPETTVDTPAVPPDSITVGYGACTFASGVALTCPNYRRVGFRAYVERVVTNEMSAAWGSYGRDTTSATGVAGRDTTVHTGLHALMAQAVAVRSYAMAYVRLNAGLDVRAPEGFICETNLCQRYGDPANPLGPDGVPYADALYRNARLAVRLTEGFVLVHPVTGAPAPAYFSASTNGLGAPAGRGCGDGFSGDPGFAAYPCSPDADAGTDGAPVSPNATHPRWGHGAGLSQSGALRWAWGTHWNPPGTPLTSTSLPLTDYVGPNIGTPIARIVRKSWREILAHYYEHPFAGRPLSEQRYALAFVDPSVPRFVARGTVRAGGLPLSGVAVALTGAASATAVTGSDGRFRLAGLLAGGYSIAPTRAGWEFDPASRTVTLGAADADGLDFAATPLAPTPSSPTGGVVVSSVTPALAWFVAGSPAGFTFSVEWANITNGETLSGIPDVQGLAALTYTLPALLPGRTYVWRVRACAAAVCSSWSAAQGFVVPVVGLPTAITPTYPADGVTVYNATVRLSWSAQGATSATRYRAYTFTCATLSCTDAPAITAGNAGYTDSGLLSTRRYTMPVLPGRGYAWYVRGEAAGLLSPPSVRMTFRVGGTATGGTVTGTPAVPVASWPVGNPLLYTLTPTLSWYLSGSASTVTGFDLRWGTAAGADAATNTVALTAGARAFVVPAGSLNWGTTYFWHVRAVGASTWTSASFTTVGAAGTLIPVVSAPTGDVVVAGPGVTLSWYHSGSSTGVVSYEVELTGPSAPVLPRVLPPAQSLAVPALTAGASYTWRVRSFNGTAYSAWSNPAGRFSVAAGSAPVVPAVGSPVEGAEAPGHGAMLSWELPVPPESALVYDVDVAEDSAFTRVMRLEGLTTPYVALGSLGQGRYYWRVRSNNGAGAASAYSETGLFHIAGSPTGAEAPGDAAPILGLEAVYPAPARGVLTVRFRLAVADLATLRVYDLAGRAVATLAHTEVPAGAHSVRWDATGVPPGLYLLRLEAGGRTAARTVVVAR